MKDRRSGWLASATHRHSGGRLDSEAGARSSSHDGADGVLGAVRGAASTAEALELLTTRVAARLARLLMIKASGCIQLSNKSVAGHGLDSMIGIESRNWTFLDFKVDVPFQQLLAGGLTTSELARTLSESSEILSQGTEGLVL